MRSLLDGSRARVLLAVVLLLFVLVCGIHVAGAHHDTDRDGVGLGDGLISFSLVVSAVFVIAGLSRRHLPPSVFRFGQPLIVVPRGAVAGGRSAFLGMPLLR
jgi:hypothetical protein